jgi:hypothetical protein
MSAPRNSASNEKGFALFAVILLMSILLIMGPAMVKWLRNESKWAAKEQKNLNAFNLAETGLDRGQWALKISTTNWTAAIRGQAIAGYNFDRTYTDVAGGQYRIFFSSGPGEKEVTILSEGRDPKTGESRAIRAVVRNSSIPGPLLSRKDIKLTNNFFVHWGPIVSQANILLGDGTAVNAGNRPANRAYPRKMARLGVTTVRSTPAVAADDRDTNGSAPPNAGGPPGTTPNDWTSYQSVADVPRLDFDALRSSAAASGTLNCFGRFGGYPAGAGFPAHTSIYSAADRTFAFANALWGKTTGGPVNLASIPCQAEYGCADSDRNCALLPTGANRIVEGFGFDPRALAGSVWYWDGTPGVGADAVKIYETGNRGTFIIRGDAKLDGDDLDTIATPLRPGWPAGKILVPTDAWREYQAIDTAATGEWPGDPGGPPGPIAANTFYAPTPNAPQMALPIITGGTEPFWMGGDIGLAGLFYTGGDLDINLAPEIYGAIWVDGQMRLNSNDLAAVFYDSSLDIPVLDVILVVSSWVEVPASRTIAWAAP